MARIRTIKPEFWEDEVVGLMPRDARLLFAATFNLADDEGLLRWTPAYIKASAFMYDDDLGIQDVTKLMQCVTDAGLLFPYIGGVARQQMAVIVNFRKHQKINRPQKSKLPPPSLQNGEVRRMYARRDGWTCQLCGAGIPQQPIQNDSHNLSIDHIKHQSVGGTDHPSNIRAAHQACNKSRRDRGDDAFSPPRSLAGLNDSLSNSVNGSVSVHQPAMRDDAESTPQPSASTQGEISSLNDSVNGSLTNSLEERKGREGNREGKGTGPSAEAGDQGDLIVAQESDFVGATNTATDEPGPVTAGTIVSEWLERCTKRPPNAVIGRTAKQIKKLLDEHIDADDIRRGIAQWMAKGADPSAIPSFVNQAMNAGAPRGNVIALTPGQPLTGTDATVAGWAALAASLAGEDSA